jgi:adenosylhomocysteine nucleosidase
MRMIRERASSRLLTAIVGASLLTACRAPNGGQPVLVQGAMDVEIRKLAGAIEHPREEKILGWTFWTGTIDGYPVVVSKTMKGMENTAAATVLAVEHFHPAAIINQGTAGGHQPDLHVFDIVLGVDAVNLGSFKTGFRARGEGSNIAEWTPLDLLRADGSAGNDPNARTLRRFHGDDALLAAARSVRDRYDKGRVIDGVIGSSEVWNSELDRIGRFHDQFGTTAEEMEAAAAAQIAGMSHVPFLGIRVLSNNITNGGAYDPKTAEACQDYVHEVVKAYISERQRSRRAL